MEADEEREELEFSRAEGGAALEMHGENSSAVTFSVRGEDHTLGNALQYVLAKDPTVEFSGYSIPHPSEDRLNLRVQTTGRKATDALRDALHDVTSIAQLVGEEFLRGLEEYDKQHETGDAQGQTTQPGPSDADTVEGKHNDTDRMEM